MNFINTVINSNWNTTTKGAHYSKVVKHLIKGDILEVIEQDLQCHATCYMRGMVELRDALKPLELTDTSHRIKLAEELVKELVFNSRVDPVFLTNFNQLLAVGLVGLMNEFSDNFRGKIRFIHQIGDHIIIETKKNRSEDTTEAFYVVRDSRLRSCYWSTLDDAILASLAVKFTGEEDAAEYAGRVLSIG